MTRGTFPFFPCLVCHRLWMTPPPTSAVDRSRAIVAVHLRDNGIDGLWRGEMGGRGGTSLSSSYLSFLCTKIWGERGAGGRRWCW